MSENARAVLVPPHLRLKPLARAFVPSPVHVPSYADVYLPFSSLHKFYWAMVKDQGSRYPFGRGAGMFIDFWGRIGQETDFSVLGKEFHIPGYDR